MDSIAHQYEIILVDDGSTDRSWEIISELSKGEPAIIGVRLQKNYGQHAAIKAGLSLVTGSLVVVMDCDLQDPPEEIIKLYTALDDQTDAVMALRMKHWQPFIKRIYSALFYNTLSLFSGIQFQPNTANFGIYRKSVIEKSISSRRSYFFFPLTIKKSASHIQYVPVQFDPDRERSTAYSFSKAFALAAKIVLSQIGFYNKKYRRQQDYVISEVKNR